MPKKQPKLEFKGFLSFLILHEIGKESLYGEELALHIGKRRGEPLTPGTIYPALKRLHKEKLVTRRKDGRKKNYTLTAPGKAELKLLYTLFGRYFIGLKGKIPKQKKVKSRKVK